MPDPISQPDQEFIQRTQEALTPDRIALLKANGDLEQAISNVINQFRTMGDAVDQRSVSASLTRFQEAFFWLNNAVVAGPEKDN